MLNLNLTRLDSDTVQRIGDVLVTAMEYNDVGVVDWASRAVHDARLIGRLRDRDIETLDRLERTYSGRYYNRNEGTGIRLQAA